MSHTISIRIEVKDKNALGVSVVELNGVVLGEGTHSLFQGKEVGYGFTLPAWTFPLVLKESGELAYDDFGGHWGDKADLGRLMELYAVHAAKAAAEAQGWMSERRGATLIIHHPAGGTLTIGSNGQVDAEGFVGSSCTKATETIEAALGSRQEENLKSEFFAERVHISAHG